MVFEVVGMGGVGKSRFLAEVTSRAALEHDVAVVTVSLALEATTTAVAPGREPGTRELPSARRQRPRANSQAAGKLPVAGARDGASSASKLQKDQVHGKSSRQ